MPPAASSLPDRRRPALPEAVQDLSAEDLVERIRLLEAVVDNFPGGISVFDKDLRMVLCNDGQKQLLEYSDELFASGTPTLEDLYRFNARRGEYGPGDIEAQVRERMALANQRRPHTFERTRPNGTVLEVRGVPLRGGGFLTTYLDVTAQRRNQDLIAHLAHHDALTDLPNRVLFRDRLGQALARVNRGETIALLCLDLDRFKVVNDRLGHAYGDALLKSVAERLQHTARETDTVARLGGDEFVFLQTGIRSADDAISLARRLIRLIERPHEVAEQRVEVGTSIGIAVAPADATEAEELLRKADLALCRCKEAGRGSYLFFEAA